MSQGANELRARTRATWSAGNYAAVAERIERAAEVLVERAGLEPGMDVLDVACGTGNAAIPAARLGTRVTGLDLVPDLLAIARERAADAMVEVDWVEGDAQELPFEDAAFDRVLSVFGHMFAPDQRRTAEELVRVCRPGGAIGTCTWTPEHSIGDMFKTIRSLLPPPPAPPPSPLLWGTEDHVRELLGPYAREIELERHRLEWEEEESPEAYALFMEESFGPMIAARAALGERAPELHEAVLEWIGRWNQADDGSVRFEGEFLLAVARL